MQSAAEVPFVERTGWPLGSHGFSASVLSFASMKILGRAVERFIEKKKNSLSTQNRAVQNANVSSERLRAHGVLP